MYVCVCVRVLVLLSFMSRTWIRQQILTLSPVVLGRQARPSWTGILGLQYIDTVMETLQALGSSLDFSQLAQKVVGREVSQSGRGGESRGGRQLDELSCCGIGRPAADCVIGCLFRGLTVSRCLRKCRLGTRGWMTAYRRRCSRHWMQWGSSCVQDSSRCSICRSYRRPRR